MLIYARSMLSLIRFSTFAEILARTFLLYNVSIHIAP